MLPTRAGHRAPPKSGLLLPPWNQHRERGREHHGWRTQHPRHAEPPKHEAAPPRRHGQPGDATSHDRAPNRSSSSPPRLARSSEDTNTTPQGGNDGAYSRGCGGRHHPDHLQPEEPGWRRRTALDLRSTADLRSAPGHPGPTYESRKPKLLGTLAPHLRQSQLATSAGGHRIGPWLTGALTVL
jgi:hypothetical protein